MLMIVGQDSFKINKLKIELSKSFAMKDLEPVKQILDMKIVQDRNNGHIWLPQEGYIEKVLERFNMDKAKSLVVHLQPISSLAQNNVLQVIKRRKR